ncbi:carboxypeptidase B-like [Euwallacea fornicatus]|uniref:carboxypeptidase B-like n=1 Tax=Euwallacea fornicatus TaxID=995702 RepID=UPI00338FEF41
MSPNKRYKGGNCASKSRKSKRKQKYKEPTKQTSTRRANSMEKSPGKNPELRNDTQSEATVERFRFSCRKYEEFHDHFLNYSQIEDFLTKIKTDYPKTVNVVTIGRSAQGRSIYLVLITTDAASSAHMKFATFVEAGLKGEDTFAVSNAIYIIDYLCKNQSYIKIMDYFVAPCGNPDAYDQFVRGKAETSRRESRKKDSSTLDKRSSDDGTKFENKKTTNKGKKRDVESAKLDKNLDHAHLKAKGKRGGSEEQNEALHVHMDLSMNFPVILGANDMKNMNTTVFLEKIKSWKENYVKTSPETQALIGVINYLFPIKLLISLRENGESVCYPFGFWAGPTEDTANHKEIAKKGTSSIRGRNFRYGNLCDIQGIKYGHLIDFIKLQGGQSIEYMYSIQVHKKTAKYDEKAELKKLMEYGHQIMECTKIMSTAVYMSLTHVSD